MPRRIGHWIQLKAIALVACPCIATAAGCASLGRPDWLDPGPIRNQRRTAVRFDPFMQNDIGPSTLREYTILDGTRPRDYSEPVAEVNRPRWWSQPVR